MGNRSYSQLNLYSDCPERFRIQRLIGVEEPPNVWLHAGTAIGNACDAIDLAAHIEGEPHSEQVETASALFVAELEQALQKHSDESEVPISEFLTTGKTQDRPNGRDLAWWKDEAPAMLTSYAQWRDEKGYRLATLNVAGETVYGVELPIELDLGNETILRGYADRLFVRPDGKYAVLDLKAGQRQPGVYQLATYAYAIGIQYGIDVPYGSFYMLAKDGHSKPKWLPPFTGGNVVQQAYRRLDEAIKGGHFVPNIGSHCFSCPVQKACRFT